MGDAWNMLEGSLVSSEKSSEEEANIYDYICHLPGQMTVREGGSLKVVRRSETDDLNDIGWGTTSHLEMHPWFHGNITRAEAEFILSSEDTGSFLVRESQSNPGQFSLSLRHEILILHYNIHLDSESNLYYIYRNAMFCTIPELVLHHSKNAGGLKTTLHNPTPNPCKPHNCTLSHDLEVHGWELDRGKIVMERNLHEGKYGQVYKATIRNGNQNKTVAVKTITMVREEGCVV